MEVLDKLDTQINSILEPLAQSLSKIIFFKLEFTPEIKIPFLVLWLITGSLFFTLYFRFLNIRGLKHTFDTLRGKYATAGSEGLISPFQALCTAVSGTVGLGNIAGVGIAISVGGAGAVFWMTVAGFLGMSSKFIECSLGMMYRKHSHGKDYLGGPMYYLRLGFAEIKGLKTIGKILAVFYSVLCIGGVLGGGNMLQVNQSYQLLLNLSGGNMSFFINKAWLFGLIIAFLVGIVIIGGLECIAKVTEKLVPFMSLIFIGSALFIIGVNYSAIPATFSEIFHEAFTATGIQGGVLGCIITGFRRSAFSSEVGSGFTAIAHASTKTNEKISEGFVSMLEPFIDTVVVCNITATVILITKAHLVNNLNGVHLCSEAFRSVSPLLPYLLFLAVISFAYSTLISYSYYGLRAWCYLFGDTDSAELCFKIIFLVCIIIGSVMHLKTILDLSDAMFLGMCLINFIGLYVMAPKVNRALKEFERRYKLKNLST
jgi:alanine or glycine:cation symporter, AGCS family